MKRTPSSKIDLLLPSDKPKQRFSGWLRSLSLALGSLALFAAPHAFGADQIPWGWKWTGQGAIHVPFAADFDGDHIADRTIVNKSTGQWFVINSSANNPQGIPWGWIWPGEADVHTPLAADFDGDGLADRCIVNRSSGTWHFIYSSGRAPEGWNWLGQGDIHTPLAADFDGDRIADKCLVNRSAGQWFIINSSGRNPQGIPWGWSWLGEGDVHVPIAADFDGDGLADRCVVNSNSGEWFIIFSSGRDPQGIPWGWKWTGQGSMHTPFAADFDGDGLADRCIVNRSTGEWFIIFSRNRAPFVSAGIDQTITLPAVASLAGTVTDDGKPNPSAALALTWSKVSGPGTVIFQNANAVHTAASFSVRGVYVLQLTANDGEFSTADELTITVVSGPGGTAPCQVPSVNAGPDQTITLPAVAVTAGSSSSSSVTWSQVSGPALASLANANAPATAVSFPAAGKYTLKLTAINGGCTSSDMTIITVNPAPPGNQAPYVNAGPDQAILYPNPATLAGVVADDGKPNGTVNISWSEVSGPGTVTFQNARLAKTSASFSVAGTYVLKLIASDGQKTTTDDITIIVRLSPPRVNAGGDQSGVDVFLGTTVKGTATSDGLPIGTLSVSWTQLSGPGKAIFTNPAVLSTKVDFDSVGTYVLRLTASDGSSSKSDDIQLNVRPPVGHPSARIQGTVRDPNNQLVNGAKVRAILKGKTVAVTSTGSGVITGVQGSYDFGGGLPPGVYSVKAEFGTKKGELLNCARFEPNVNNPNPAVCNVNIK